MKLKNLEKSVILRKVYLAGVSLKELYNKLGNCEYIEDLRLETSEKNYIIGTVRKP